jgi:hypothetical protein
MTLIGFRQIQKLSAIDVHTSCLSPFLLVQVEGQYSWKASSHQYEQVQQQQAARIAASGELESNQ